MVAKSPPETTIPPCASCRRCCTAAGRQDLKANGVMSHVSCWPIASGARAVTHQQMAWLGSEAQSQQLTVGIHFASAFTYDLHLIKICLPPTKYHCHAAMVVLNPPPPARGIINRRGHWLARAPCPSRFCTLPQPPRSFWSTRPVRIVSCSRLRPPHGQSGFPCPPSCSSSAAS